MMNLNKIIDLLKGDSLYKKIDEPIDEAFGKFIYSQSESISQKGFRNTIISFIKFLKNNQLIIGSYTEVTETSEVILFSEMYYQGHDTHGYEGAMYDITSQGGEGIESVLEAIVERIKTTEKEKYISWLITKYFTLLDWDTKAKIISEIIEQFGYLFPEQVKELQISRLVPRIQELINLIISTNQTVFGILNRS